MLSISEVESLKAQRTQVRGNNPLKNKTPPDISANRMEGNRETVQNSYVQIEIDISTQIIMDRNYYDSLLMKIGKLEEIVKELKETD